MPPTRASRYIWHERMGRFGAVGFLAVIVAACLVGMTLAGFSLVSALRGDGGLNGRVMCFCMAAGSILTSTRTILLD